MCCVLVFKIFLFNFKIWNNLMIGIFLNFDVFVNGGWWYDFWIFVVMGEGIVKEELCVWEGWWNEKIVEFV